MQSSITEPRFRVETYLDTFDAATERFAARLAEGDLTAPIAGCPEWDLAGLADHLGGIHQWARHAVLAGNPDGQPTTAPADQAELVRWYRDCAQAVGQTLRTTDPEQPVWHFGPKPRLAAFWSRRQAHEAVMHLHDAATSQHETSPIDDAFARDGLDEALTVFFPRQVRLGRMASLERSLALRTPDGESWLISGDGTSPTTGPAPEAIVSGPAASLLLLLWGRTSVDDASLLLEGDETAARVVLGSGLVP